MKIKKQIDSFRQLLVKSGRDLKNYAIIITGDQMSALSLEKGVDFNYCENLFMHSRAKDMVIVPIAHLTEDMELVWSKF